jgi:DNA-binding HxlR family transcriptional regulator
MDALNALPWCDCQQGPAQCCRPFCPYYHATVELIGRRWTGAILRALLSGLHRFGDLAATIPDMSDRMLSERLKELEAEGIVVRTVIPDTPVRIEYHLTAKGRALESVVEAILAWAGAWLAPPRHGEH